MKKSWQERAWELLEEQRSEGLQPPAERVRRRLQWEDWETGLGRMVGLAEEQMRRGWWRGKPGGVPPEGYDGNSLVSEATKELLAGKGRLVMGWTRQRLERELWRLVNGTLRRLQSRKEAAQMRGEWDVLPLDEGEQPSSVFEELPGVIGDGAGELLNKEAERAVAMVEGEIASALAGDAVALGLFRCLCDGVVKRREIAAKLGVDVRAVTAGRKRLERRLDEYGRKHPGPARGFIEELKRL